MVYQSPLMKIEIQCIKCHDIFTVNCYREDYAKWKDGELIQNAMPYLDANMRELLISGICGGCYENLFPE